MYKCAFALLATVFMIVCINVNAADPRVDEHTVALLTFDDIAGDSARDISQNGLDGKMNGVDLAEGIAGQAVLFADDGDSVLLGPDAKLDFKKDFTIEAWVNPDNVAARMDLVCKHEGGAYAFIIDVGGLIKPCHHNGGYIWGDSSTPLVPGEWTYVATTYDGDSLKVYINGELDGEKPMAGYVTPTNVPLAIGGNPGPGGVLTSFFYKGLVDEFRISSVARTEEEIKAAMDPASPVKPMGKLATTWSETKNR
jgi:hypothetical protein